MSPLRRSEEIDGVRLYRTLEPAAPRHSRILAGIPAWMAVRQLGLGCVYEMRIEGVVDLVEALARLIKQGRNDLAGLIVGTGTT
jgi:hypothetical protein